MAINTFLPGEVFATSGPSSNINAWRMYTGAGTGTEKFVLYNPATSSDMLLQSTVGNMILIQVIFQEYLLAAQDTQALALLVLAIIF